MYITIEVDVNKFKFDDGNTSHIKKGILYNTVNAAVRKKG